MPLKLLLFSEHAITHVISSLERLLPLLSCNCVLSLQSPSLIPPAGAILDPAPTQGKASPSLVSFVAWVTLYNYTVLSVLKWNRNTLS